MITPILAPSPGHAAGALTLALLCSLPAAAVAQPAFPLNVELPKMALRICPTLEAARKEAALAEQLGKEAFKDGTLTSGRSPGCDGALLTVKPVRLEPAIAPVVTWVLQYDEKSQETIKGTAEGEGDVPASPSLRQVRYYYSTIALPGRTVGAWVELPDEPYMLMYRRARGQQ